MKPYKAYAHIYSLDGEMDKIRSRFFFLKNNKENFYAEIKSRSKKRNTKNY